MEGENELAATPAEETVTDQVAEDVTEKPVAAEGDAVEQTEGDKPEGDDDDGDKPEKKKPSGAERNKRRLQLVQAELDRLSRENDELKRPKAENKEGRPGIDREPKEEDFPNDFFAYSEARTAWRVTQALEAKEAQRRTERQQDLQREIRAERMEAYEENKAVVRERIPDFDKVLKSAGQMMISDELAHEMLASDQPALLQYHFANNPDVARDLSQLSGNKLARALGRLEARLRLPSGKKATDASAPPAKVKGGAAPPFDPNKSDDMDAYVAWRKKNGFGSR
jgi:hypothetical protein